MGLDVYVGSLTRYYAGDWETVVQQFAREEGISLQVVGREEPDDAIRDPDEIRDAVERWRAELSSVLGEELSWNEEREAPYFTDKPAWNGYGSLQVLAAHDERGKTKLPKEAVSEWEKERTWRKAASKSAARYRHLYTPELWLPCDFDPPFKMADAADNAVFLGSSVQLLTELRELNERTYKGSADDLARWRFEGAENGLFDDAARFGLGVFLELAEKAVAERLPMKLDY